MRLGEDLEDARTRRPATSPARRTRRRRTRRGAADGPASRPGTGRPACRGGAGPRGRRARAGSAPRRSTGGSRPRTGRCPSAGRSRPPAPGSRAPASPRGAPADCVSLRRDDVPVAQEDAGDARVGAPPSGPYTSAEPSGARTSRENGRRNSHAGPAAGASTRVSSTEPKSNVGSAIAANSEPPFPSWPNRNRASGSPRWGRYSWYAAVSAATSSRRTARPPGERFEVSEGRRWHRGASRREEARRGR